MFRSALFCFDSFCFYTDVNNPVLNALVLLSVIADGPF